MQLSRWFLSTFYGRSIRMGRHLGFADFRSPVRTVDHVARKSEVAAGGALRVITMLVLSP